LIPTSSQKAYAMRRKAPMKEAAALAHLLVF